MSTMIEKVARAIAAAEGREIGEAPDFAQWHWEEFTDHARSAIAAMREPHSPACAAGIAEIRRHAAIDYIDAPGIRAAFNAMIDAILADKP